MDHPLGGGPLSLSCITRVAPHCVNTLMILSLSIYLPIYLSPYLPIYLSIHLQYLSI